MVAPLIVAAATRLAPLLARAEVIQQVVETAANVLGGNRGNSQAGPSREESEPSLLDSTLRAVSQAVVGPSNDRGNSGFSGMAGLDDVVGSLREGGVGSIAAGGGGASRSNHGHSSGRGGGGGHRHR